jgi:adenylate cyclase
VSLIRNVETRLTWLSWVASGAGTVVVFISIGFLIPIFGDADERTDLALFNGPLVAAYLLIYGLGVQRHANRRLRRTLQWVAEGRDPDQRQHRRTLELAVYEVKLIALGWLGAAILFFALNAAVNSVEFAAVAGVTTLLGGGTTCALIYLASERILRPVTALALGAGRGEGKAAPSVRGRLGMAWVLGTGVPLLGVLVVAVVGVTKADVVPGKDIDTAYVSAAVLFLAGVALAIGLLATLFAAKAIADPVTSVRKGVEQIERGDLDAHVLVDDGSEVGLLQAGFNRMAEGLRERERIRDLFGRQVGEDVARAALRGGTRLGGEEREVGALFVDLVGFTSMAMAMPPTEVVRVLNRFFRVVVEVVEGECGLVNKFEGDSALCVFGAPVARDDPAGDAMRAARTLAERLSHDLPETDFGIGISAGIAVAGNVGAEHRFEYTVIGDPVNEAARLCELAKQRPDRVLASEAALAKASPAEREAWTLTESAVLRGRNTPTGLAHPGS